MAGPLMGRQQIDVQMRRITRQFGQDHPLRAVHQLRHRIARRFRRSPRQRIAEGERRQPLLPVALDERCRVGGADDVADSTAAVVGHEGEIRLQPRVRTREDVRQQLLVGVEVPGVAAFMAGPYADVVESGPVLWAVGADHRL
jgi:hypothetical protein